MILFIDLLRKRNANHLDRFKNLFKLCKSDVETYLAYTTNFRIIVQKFNLWGARVVNKIGSQGVGMA